MFSKILGLILLVTIVFFSSFKENLNYEVFKNKKKTNQCSKLNYEELDYIENQNFSDLSFEVYFKNKRKWKTNRLEAHIQSEKNKLASSEGIKFYNISERQKGFIKIKTNKIECTLEASIRPHGNFEDHRIGNMPSLNINLKEGNIKGITRFLLLKPETRNGNNEIFTTILLKNVGFLTPTTFKTDLFYNDQKFNVIFQEKRAKEMLERNNLRESFMLEVDERFYRLDPVEAKHFSLYGVSNSKLVLKNEKNRIIAEYATSLLNDLNRVHVKLERDIKDFSTLSQILNKDYFERVEVYDALMYSLYASHGIEYDDRIFYFDPFSRKFLPIYYDGMGNILDKKKNKLSKRNITEKDKFLPSGKKGASQAFKAISEINLEFLQLELRKMGVFIDKEELYLVIEKIKSNLSYLNSLDEDQLYKISAVEEKEVINSKVNSYNKSLKRNFVYYSDDFQKFITCEFNKVNCRDFNTNTKDISELLRQNLSYNQTHFVYLGQNLLGSSSKNFYYQNVDKIRKNNFDTKIINDEIKIFYNKKTNIEFFENKKEIHIKNSGQEKIVFFDSSLKNWKIFFSRDQIKDEKNEISNFTRSDEYGLTGCLTFLNSKIHNLKLNIENMECEDSVNFINTIGSVEELKIKNSKYDGVDADFSEISFKDVEIKNSGNDCLDFSYGNYKIQNALLVQCSDKAISTGEKSMLKVEKINISNSNIGIASKDSSKVFIDNAEMKDITNCLSSYKKKQEFWGGYIFSNNIKCSNFFEFLKKDKYSKIIINKSI
ncbi:hypothetical protein [Candidatus Pelagibacter communis]|uniref:hypothetical protein n=1 Tax=Pelagibacter ubique TaxID=198252 RepID=UPI00094DCC0A|nr:hypothetical protein [Candidatus Pelagibacter ubique]